MTGVMNSDYSCSFYTKGRYTTLTGHLLHRSVLIYSNKE
jgi:hypothetical protein